MTIAMVASEANPLCKTGGLADVIGSLSRELCLMGEDCFVVLPFYKCIKDSPFFRVKREGSFNVFMAWRCQNAEVFSLVSNGVTYYLIGNDYYFNRESLYGFDDDGERFAFFTLAAWQLFECIDKKPDIIHVHDWQTGMLPVLIRERSMQDPRLKDAKLVLTLHNEAFKGYLDQYFLNHFYGLNDEIFNDGRVRFDGMVSTLKAAIVYCDAVVAVSPNHAKELLSPGDSMRLDGVLSNCGERFRGIVNGVDQVEFDPESDPLIGRNYNAKTVKAGKTICRKKLLSSFHFDPENDAPVFGLVSRLTYQKGIDLALTVGEKLLERGCILAVLGSGEWELESRLEHLRSRFPESCGIYLGFNNQLAHDIYSGSDFFLMPSLFEPCGIGQMIALRYGTLPICRSVGGLKDTVIAYNGKNEDVADGFLFEDYNVEALSWACEYALQAFCDEKKMRRLIVNAMKADHSWRKSANEYLSVYRSLLG